MQEIWVDAIVREFRFLIFDGYYEASNLGRVRNKKTKELCTQKLVGRGYLHVRLINLNSPCKKKGKYWPRVHRIIWDSFHPDKQRWTHKIDIDHINEDKTDNRLDNLQLLTSRENTAKGQLKYRTSKLPTSIGSYTYKDGTVTTYHARVLNEFRQRSRFGFSTDINITIAAYEKEFKRLVDLDWEAYNKHFSFPKGHRFN